MKIVDIVDRIENEKQILHRFPARVIFTRNLSDYNALVSKLENVCDCRFDLATFCKNDLVPKFKELNAELKKNKDKTILILSLGEYLRLCPLYENDKDRGGGFKSLWESADFTSTTTKYIMPIFGGREVFYNVISSVDDRQKDFIWEIDDDSADTEINITVYSPEFVTAVRADAESFSDWISKWNTLYSETRSDFSLITKLCKYTNASLGNVKIEKFDEPFSYIKSRVTDGDLLAQEIGDNYFWSEVVTKLQPNTSFIKTIDEHLNSTLSFDPAVILARYKEWNSTKRQLFALRCRLYPTGDYISYAVSKTVSVDAIPESVRDSIFELTQPTAAQFSERKQLLNVLPVTFDDSYFSKIDKIRPTENRLSYLSYKSFEERAYAIKTVCELLRGGADPVSVSENLTADYPSLAEYLNPTGKVSHDIDIYFRWYRKNKLINRIPDTMPLSLDFDAFESRNKIISNSDNGYPFWVDGLGAEWYSLLQSRLNAEIPKSTTAFSFEANIATAIIPTETEYNHHWEKDDLKWDRLDKLAHKGVTDDKSYFSCIAKQLEYIDEIVSQVIELLKEHNVIILTGDHGSSRLAALSFHAGDTFVIPPPKNSTVRAFGRFCEIQNENDVAFTDDMELVSSYNYTKKCEKQCVAIKNYDHFKQSGNAAAGNTDEKDVCGEVHGGMTPEEYLVPVFIIKRTNPIELLRGKKKRSALISTNDMGLG
jgi:hypothetical protein